MKAHDIFDNTTSIVTHYYNQISNALKHLGNPTSSLEIEKLCFFVVTAMGSELRDYHKPEHPLDVSKRQTPVATLAAIFHDIVYVQVDPSWKTFLKDHLGNFLPNETLVLDAKHIYGIERNPVRKAIISIFGMENRTDVMPGKGINELLSAIVMESLLSSFISDKQILFVAACIEATIPFRGKDSEGRSCAEVLSSRMNRISKTINLEISMEDIAGTISSARELVENDLSSFAHPRLNTFISNTWNVMNENNATLRNTFFTVSEYRKAVYGVIPFLNSLDPHQMFWNDPNSLDIKQKTMTENAEKNIRLGAEYLNMVGLSLSLVEAVSLECGGDAPFETIVGSTRKSREHVPRSVGACLTARDGRELDPDEKLVFQILKNGRDLRARFDRKECPIGAYLYQALNKVELKSSFSLAQKFHKQEISSMDFIRSFPEFVRSEIINALLKTNDLRFLRYIDLMKALEQKKAA